MHVVSFRQQSSVHQYDKQLHAVNKLTASTNDQCTQSIYIVIYQLQHQDQTIMSYIMWSKI